MTTWADVKTAIHFWNTGDTWGEGRLGIFDADEKQWIYDRLEEFYENSPTAQYWLNLLTLPGVVGLRIGEGAQLEALDGRTSVSFIKDVDLVMVNQSGTLVTSQSKYHLIHEILERAMLSLSGETKRGLSAGSLPNWGPEVRACASENARPRS